VRETRGGRTRGVQKKLIERGRRKREGAKKGGRRKKRGKPGEREKG